MLQQTTEDLASKSSTKTVLQQVVEGDPYRNMVLEQVNGMAHGFPLQLFVSFKQYFRKL